MKLQNNQSGIAHALVVLLIAVILGAAGYAGWRVFSADKAKEVQSSSATESGVETQSVVPDDWVKFDKKDIIFYHPKTWSEAESLDRAEDYMLQDAESGLSIAVYKTKPRIYYSSNAPFMCMLESENWRHYEISSSKPIKRVNDDECSRVISDDVNGNKAHSATGGALGQVKYVVAVEVQGGTVVLSEARSGNFIGSGGPDDQASEDAEKALVASLDAFVDKFTEVN